MNILLWVAILPIILARMSSATEDKAEIKAEIKRELKEELTSELLSRCMSNASKQEDNLFMGEAVITRDDCDAAKFHNVNRIEFSLDIDKHDDKDCYAEITFPHERDFKLIVLNFKVRKSSILRVSFFKCSLLQTPRSREEFFAVYEGPITRNIQSHVPSYLNLHSSGDMVRLHQFEGRNPRLISYQWRGKVVVLRWKTGSVFPNPPPSMTAHIVF